MKVIIEVDTMWSWMFEAEKADKEKFCNEATQALIVSEEAATTIGQGCILYPILEFIPRKYAN